MGSDHYIPTWQIIVHCTVMHVDTEATHSRSTELSLAQRGFTDRLQRAGRISLD
jgi:hypothetical protein